MPHKVIGFVDGENLVLRYQDMLKDGRIPDDSVIHVPNMLVWHPDVTTQFYCDIARVSFYQTVIGDSMALDSAKETISQVEYSYRETENRVGESSGHLVPRVFKKEGRSSKTKSVDINLTVDMLRTAANGSFDVLWLLSGDGDYLPLVEEITRQGKQVWVSAFSKGLSSDLKFAADEFTALDNNFFRKMRQSRKHSKA